MAHRKVKELLATGTRVVLVAPQITAGLHQLAADGRLEWKARKAEANDVAGATLVVAATNDPATNARIWKAAQSHGALINVVDNPPHCDFITPAIVRRNNVTIAISTGGKSPALAAHLRRRVEEVIGPEYGLLADLLGSLRERVMAELPDPAQRAVFWQRLVESDLLDTLRLSGENTGEPAKQARARAKKMLVEFIKTFRE